MGIKIISIGGYKPKVHVTNEIWSEKFAPLLEIAGNKFTRHASKGVCERYYAAPEETVVSMATEAIADCLKKADVPAEKIDLLIHLTNIPDELSGDISEILESANLSNAFAHEIYDVACAGAIIAFQQAAAFLSSGTYENIIVSCVSNVATRGGNMGDVFGCAAGDIAVAMLFSKGETGGFLISEHKTFGQYSHIFEFGPVKEGVMAWPLEHKDKYWANQFHFLRPQYMEELYGITRNVISKMVLEMMDKANLNGEKIEWLITHQPGEMAKDWRELFGFTEEKHLGTFKEIANCAMSNIPYTMMRAMDENKFSPGDKILLVTAGRGIHVALGIWEW